MILDDLHNNFRTVIDSLNEMMVETMVESKEEIIDLNLSQLAEGLTKEGTAIQPELENEDYAKGKKSQGGRAPFGTPDLHNEGDFWDGFYAEDYIGSNDESSGLFINSRDEKAEKLESKYSHIYGISPQNEEEVQDLILDKSINKIINGLTNI